MRTATSVTVLAGARGGLPGAAAATGVREAGPRRPRPGVPHVGVAARPPGAPHGLPGGGTALAALPRGGDASLRGADVSARVSGTPAVAKDCARCAAAYATFSAPASFSDASSVHTLNVAMGSQQERRGAAGKIDRFGRHIYELDSG